METSFHALITSQWFFLVAAVYKLYPTPFLLLFVVQKFLFKRLFFNKDYDAMEDSMEFYNKWKKLGIINIILFFILGALLVISLLLLTFNIL